MLQTERQMVADHAVSRVGKMLGSGVDEVLSETLSQNFVLLFAAVDSAADAANRPLIITELLPGYDVVVARAAVNDSAEMYPKAGMDIRGGTPVSPEFLRALTMALDQEFSEAGNSSAALMFESKDGSCYVAFQSKNRAEALMNMGISLADLSMVLH